MVPSSSANPADWAIVGSSRFHSQSYANPSEGALKDGATGRWSPAECTAGRIAGGLRAHRSVAWELASNPQGATTRAVQDPVWGPALWFKNEL